MNYGKVKSIYNRNSSLYSTLLSWITQFIPIQWMYGPGFRKFYKLSWDSQYFSRRALEEKQNKQLRKLIDHAYKNVPYYTRLFDSLGLNPSDIRTKDDLKKLPLLTKDIVRREFESLTAKNKDQFTPSSATTSGSTGIPFKFYLDQKNREKEYALVWRHLNWMGIRFNDKIATFRGDLMNRNSGILWEYHALKKELNFSTFNMTKNNIREYVKKLQEIKPALIRGYPSAIYLLARFILRHNINTSYVLAIQTSSEVLSNIQRKTIEQAFGALVLDWYGSSEYVISAGECPTRSGYHLNEDWSIVELIKDRKSGDYQLVGTSLYNFSMPLIRYVQEDLVRISRKPCTCGRKLRLLESISGRCSDNLMTTRGVFIPATTYAYYWEKRIGLDNIDFIQTVQKEKKLIVLRIVKSDGFAQKDIDFINSQLRMILGKDMKIQYEFLSEIPNHGKWRFSKSELSRKNRC